MKNIEKQAYELDDKNQIIKTYLKKIPLIPPKKAYKILEKKGYRGQDLGRKSLCLSAYRHVKRIKSIYVNNIHRETIPPKNNMLLLGPTGCGKTFLIELLFKHILNLPTVIVDMTSFSETGYIGEDTRTILTRLLLEADSDPSIASIGIICMDEFDKLSSNKNGLKSDGQSITKDVSGYGVQRELLKMLEESNVEVPSDFDNSLYSTKQNLFTGDIMFIACGAFSNFKFNIFLQNKIPRIGFKEPPSNQFKIDYSLTEEDVNEVGNFQNYGFIPELIGRFSRVVPMQPLDKTILKKILVDNVVTKFKKEFDREGLELEIKEEVLDYVAEKSYNLGIGARGLGSMLTYYIEEIAFEYFCGPPAKITFKLENNKIQYEYKKLFSKVYQAKS